MPTKYIILALIISFSSCKRKTEQGTQASKLLTYSSRFADSSQLKKHAFNINYPTKGTVCYPRNTTYDVSFPTDVEIKSIYTANNQPVKKGTLLLEIEHPGIADLQQEYLTAKANYTRYKNNFTRQGELAIEHATTIKNMEVEEAHFLHFEAQVKALEKKLSLLQIKPEQVTADNIRTAVKIVAPTSGVVHLSPIHPGSTLSSGNNACSITSSSKVFFELVLPASFYPHLTKEATVEIQPWNDGMDTLYLTIKSIDEKIRSANEFLVQTNEISNPGLPLNYQTKAAVIFKTNELISAKNQFILGAPHNFILIKNKGIADTVFVNSGLEWEGRTQLINFPASLATSYAHTIYSKQ